MSALLMGERVEIEWNIVPNLYPKTTEGAPDDEEQELDDDKTESRCPRI